MAGLMMAGEVMAIARCDPGTPTVLSIAPIEVPASPTVGQLLGDPNGYPFEIPNAMRCSYDTSVVIDYWSYMTFARRFDFAGYYLDAQGFRVPVFRSGVPGVGVGMVAQDRDVGPFVGVAGQATLRSRVNPGLPSWGVRGRLFFFVTGNTLQGGVIPGGPVGALRIYTASSMHNIVIGNIMIGPPRKPTCLVSTPALTMNLGEVSARLFGGVGTVAGATTGTITLQCDGGTGASVDVWVTLTDQTNPANRSDRLSLTAGSSAEGVALQLLHGAQVLSYGEDSSAVGNVNQWPAGSTDNGIFQIALTARYVQTLPYVRGGTANGVATFTLSYR